MEPPAPTPVRVQETPAPAPPAPSARLSIPGLESVRPMPTRAPRPVEGGPPPGPAEFDQPGMWEKVVALVLQRKRMLGHFLETARPLGWQDNVLVLEVDPAHRGLIEHRDNRAPLIAALSEVYGRALDYRCVDAAPGATAPPPQALTAHVATPVPAALPEQAASLELEEPPHPSEAPAGFAEPSPAVDTTAAEAPAPTAPPTPPAATPGPAPAQRKHPAELSPEARNTMLWLEGEIVGPPRPNLSS
jgi:hypothetical protein